MIELPRVNSHSTAARVCLGVAILCTALLATMLTSALVL